ncbi:hypothetical protein H257_12426 [Aphanomyces astaci]|uniref:Uncharacterized protein n=1 Tax=Aphanomyces astaci TaxID=112090 RepID=W4G187_APHAT|nr:hypothetical protein H257_12426 [Aphanomyces astaci]ETV72683.1 hypothetical protein H257_12426 [Aphanomyces astaci]|eukprot:XP_009837911.1 hypothetical protein H257_12426 [Aphanomyces astaci]
MPALYRLRLAKQRTTSRRLACEFPLRGHGRSVRHEVGGETGGGDAWKEVGARGESHALGLQGVQVAVNGRAGVPNNVDRGRDHVPCHVGQPVMQFHAGGAGSDIRDNVPVQSFACRAVSKRVSLQQRNVASNDVLQRFSNVSFAR